MISGREREPALTQRPDRAAAGPPICGAILAGGRASRFAGRPKGLELVGGERILDRLVQAFLLAQGRLPLLIANAPDAPSWREDLAVFPDREPGLGSLGGIATAVAQAPGGVVCVAWDMPFVPPALIAKLGEGLASYDAYLPESNSRRGVEPLCAAYGPACGPAIQARLAAGDRRAIAFHDDVKTGILSAEGVRRFGDPRFLFFNVNTAEDLTEADHLWQRHASCR
ncbi:MAG TPA: molybdenum cofactor guanylyltransferase [Streptosporangiaceae bacterium]|nr:molybdenum cofactor guanylyltransferase [Streptosporangiaceae bacterium]